VLNHQSTKKDTVSMLIIFGFRTRLKLLAREAVECPVCKTTTWFRVVSLRRWFTLFFIPILPLQLVGAFTECQNCGMSMRLTAAQAAPYLSKVVSA
jgi:hypothetical protein